jgi:hypothetical protein
MPEPVPDDPLAPRLLALCRETEEVCDSVGQAVARCAGGLERLEAAHLGELPAALESAAAAVERAREAVRRAAAQIAGAGARNGAYPPRRPACNSGTMPPPG